MLYILYTQNTVLKEYSADTLNASHTKHTARIVHIVHTVHAVHTVQAVHIVHIVHTVNELQTVHTFKTVHILHIVHSLQDGRNCISARLGADQQQGTNCNPTTSQDRDGEVIEKPSKIRNRLMQSFVFCSHTTTGWSVPQADHSEIQSW